MVSCDCNDDNDNNVDNDDDNSDNHVDNDDDDNDNHDDNGNNDNREILPISSSLVAASKKTFIAFRCISSFC